MPALAVSLAAVAVAGYLVRRDDGRPSTPTARRAEAGRTLLLAHRSGDGRIDLAVVVGAAGSRTAVLLLPPSAQVDVPSFEVRPLAEVATLGGAPLLRTTVANLLGIRVDETLLVDDAGLEALVAPATPLRVRLAAPVTFGEDLPAEFPAGTRDLDAGDAVRLLVTPQPGSELDRLVTVGEVISAWLDALRIPGRAQATLAATPETRPLVEAAEGRRRVDTLPVRSRSVGDEERFEVARAELEAYRREALRPLLVAGGRPRVRVEVLNGTGRLAVAQAVAALVVPAGGQVTLTGNVPGFGVRATQVVYYRDADREAAQRMLDALGCGKLRRARRAIGVVDVTIIHGADCPLETEEPPAS